MTLPGFSAQSTLYRTSGQYMTTRRYSGDGGVVPQQLAPQISDSQLYWCRLACLYCRYTGYYCWTCYICGWIIILGGATASQPELG
jgi:hypothetical protein